MKALLASFGGNGTYAASAILAVILVLIIWAFSQGRPVEFWPPKIGARPERKAHSAPGGDRRRLASRGCAQVARKFEVADAAQFYQEIALNYDQRNSGNLLATHMEVITRIDQARKIKPALRVLDLGGGTGQSVATYFFNDRHIRWTYVQLLPGHAQPVAAAPRRAAVV